MASKTAVPADPQPDREETPKTSPDVTSSDLPAQAVQRLLAGKRSLRAAAETLEQALAETRRERAALLEKKQNLRRRLAALAKVEAISQAAWARWRDDLAALTAERGQVGKLKLDLQRALQALTGDDPDAGVLGRAIHGDGLLADTAGSDLAEGGRP